MKAFETHSAEETTQLGRELARELKPETIVLLRGDLGAGKTTLVKGIAEGFQAAKAARGAPYIHGALAGLASFTAWLTLRMATHLVLGERLLGKEGDTAVTVVLTVATVALLSMSGGILGGLLARRDDGGPA